MANSQGRVSVCLYTTILQYFVSILEYYNMKVQYNVRTLYG